MSTSSNISLVVSKSDLCILYRSAGVIKSVFAPDEHKTMPLPRGEMKKFSHNLIGRQLSSN